MPAMSANEAIATMEQTAKRMEAETQAAKSLSRAKTALILANDTDNVFFATLIMRLPDRVDWSIETMATNGKVLLYNPAFVAALPDKQLRGVLIHEAMHCANKHFARQGTRHALRFNIAADCAINHILREAKVQLPPSGMFPEKFGLPPGLSAEEYYTLLPPGVGEGGGADPGGCGAIDNGIDDGLSPAEVRQLESEWNSNVAAARQAATSRHKGDLSVGLERLCGDAIKPSRDWKSELRQFMTQSSKDDYSWSRPNRRYIHRGLYLPSRYSIDIDRIAVAIDTSGSISNETLTRFASEVGEIAANCVKRIVTIYHDSIVVKTEEWCRDDGQYSLVPCGGGGTAHEPVFNWISKHMDEPPSVLLLLTDLQSSFPAHQPDYPVLWVSTAPRETHPWGERIDIPAA